VTQTLDKVQVAIARALQDGDAETPALDARLLLRLATGLSHEALITHGQEPIAPDEAARLADYVARRLAGEPVSRIKGVRDFYGRDFLVDSATLDPRPDTETLVDAALEAIARDGSKDRPLKVLDLGTGSGCILLTLLAELPLADGIGTDISEGALRIAAENARRLGVAPRARFLAADWLDGVEGAFDLIVSNPPYIPGAEIAGLAREVAIYDPRRALDGGPDGLDAYRRIAEEATARLAPGGQLLLEIGASQADSVLALLREVGFAVDEACVRRDLGGRPRCILAGNPGERGMQGPRPGKMRLEICDVQGSFTAAK
jgi:release factor glutamine methyltransferase